MQSVVSEMVPSDAIREQVASGLTSEQAGLVREWRKKGYPYSILPAHSILELAGLDRPRRRKVLRKLGYMSHESKQMAQELRSR